MDREEVSQGPDLKRKIVVNISFRKEKNTDIILLQCKNVAMFVSFAEEQDQFVRLAEMSE